MRSTDHMVMGVDFIVGDLDKPPPEYKEGFERARDNEYVLLKKLPVCSVRTMKIVVKTCCSTEHIYCDDSKKRVTRKTCLDCESPKT